jgi:hypothetical protein
MVFSGSSLEILLANGARWISISLAISERRVIIPYGNIH